MCKIFDICKTYSFDELAEIACKNNMTTIDCLKDENIVSLEGFDGKNLSGTIVFEFKCIADDKFKMIWFEPDWCDYI